MFDPHRTRRSNRRYYTRKGQVLQASPVDVNPVIDQRLVPIYKNYLLKNNLVNSIPSPPPIKALGIVIESEISNEYYFKPFTEFVLRTEETFTARFEPGSRLTAALLFQQKTDGSLYFFTCVLNGIREINVTHNVKCYYRTISISTEADYNGKGKGLYHTSQSNENIFLSFDSSDNEAGQNLNISSQINVEL